MELVDEGMCFICGKANPIGLKVDFTVDAEALKISGVFTPRREHEGYRGILHGGLVSALLDEAMVKLLWEVGIPSVSASLEVRLAKPAKVGEPLHISGWVDSQRGSWSLRLRRSWTVPAAWWPKPRPSASRYRRTVVPSIHFSDIMARAKRIAKAGRPRIAVAGADDEMVLEVISDAAARGFAAPMLFGDEARIMALAKAKGIRLGNCEIVDARDSTSAARGAAEAAGSGEADVLMKGNVTTATIMKAALDPEIGIKGSGLMTHVALLEVPGYDRMIFMSDGGIVIEPDLEQKVEITRNAIATAAALGVRMPRVALLSSIEVVNLKIRSSVDAALISKMADRGQIKGAIVDGPLAFDNAVSSEAARHKGIKSPVAGRADILIVGHADVGNVMYKAVTYLGGKGPKTAGVIVGGKVPMVVVSRADTYDARLNSIAVACVLAFRA